MMILVMADLEMLVLSKANFDAYDDDFFERFFTVAEDYHGWVQNYEEAKWLFSDELLDELQAAFPWNATSPRLTDLIGPFFEWIQRARARMELVILNDLEIEFELQPNIHAGYVEQDYPDLLLVWLNVLATNIEWAKTLIFSFEGKPNQVALLHPSHQSSQTFPLIRDEGEWQAVLAESDLWLKHQLPKDGAYPYVPAASYRRGDKEFPRQFYPPRQAVAFRIIRDGFGCLTRSGDSDTGMCSAPLSDTEGISKSAQMGGCWAKTRLARLRLDEERPRRVALTF